MFSEIKNIIKEVNKSAHLWPGIFIGPKSSWVNRPINQF